MPATRLVVIDASVNNAAALQAALAADPSVQILMLDPLQDALTQIQASLSSASLAGAAFSTLDLFSAGSAGSLSLGGTVLDATTLAAQQAQWATIGAQMAPGASLMLYGSSIAAGSSGQAFIDSLASASGLTVAASTDATGTGNGANWTLEATSTGAILTTSSLTPNVSGLLDNIAPVASPMAGYSAVALPSTGGSVVSTADFNSDGRPDVLTKSWTPTSNSYTLSLQTTNAAGGLDAPQVIQNVADPSYQAWGWNSASLSVISTADFNGDGKADLLTQTRFRDPNMDWISDIKLQTSNATGFDDPVTVQSSQITVYDNLFNQIDDFNGDGKPDLLTQTTTNFDPTTGVWNYALQLHTSNATGFDAPQTLSSFPTAATPAAPSTPATPGPDFNGDGTPDRVSQTGPNNNTLVVELSNASGGFDAPVAVQTSPDLYGWGWTSQATSVLQTADVNGDSRPDLITQSIYLDPSNGNWRTDVSLITANAAGFDAPQLLSSASGWNSAAILSTTDLNGDGKADFLITTNGTSVQQLISSAATAAEDTLLTLTLQATDANGSISSFTLPSLPQHGTLYLDDALTQPVTASTALAASANTLTLYFQPDANWNGLTAMSYIATDDQGANSAPVVQTLSITPVNDGAPVAPATALSMPVGTEDTAFSVTSADLLQGWSDVDGHALFVTGVTADHGTFTAAGSDTWVWTPEPNYKGPLTLSYQVADGFGGFTNATRTVDITPVNDAPVVEAKIQRTDIDRIVATADLNGDGKADLITSTWGTDPATGRWSDLIQLQTTNGTGFDAPITVQSHPWGYNSIQVTDINGDGNLDLLTQDGGIGILIRLFAGNGSGLDAPQYLNSIPTDFNGDGKPDLITRTYGIIDPTTGQQGYLVQLQTSNATGFDAPVTLQFSQNVINVFSTTDLNGDGRPDLLTSTWGTDLATGQLCEQIQLQSSNGSGYDAPVTLQSRSNLHAIHFVSTDDVNGDGRPDLVIQNRGNGDNAHVQISELTLTGPAQQRTVVDSTPSGYSVHTDTLNANGTYDNGPASTISVGRNTMAWGLTQGDLNGDGLADLVVFDSSHSKTDLLLARPDGSYAASVSLVNCNGNPSLKDLNGDGRLDIVSNGGNTVILNPFQYGLGESGTAIAVGLHATDVDSTVASFRLDSLPAHGTVYLDAAMTQPLAVGVDVAAVNGNATVYFKSDAGWSGHTSLSVVAVDNQGAVSAAADQYIHVTPSLNTAPALTGTQALMALGSEDQSYPISLDTLLAGFTDANGDTLSVANLSANHGTLSGNATTGWTFTPDANFNGAVNLSFDVIDNRGGVTPASQSFSLTAVNDAPVLTGTAATLAAGTEDTAYTLNATDLLAGFTDVEGNALSVANLTATNGTLLNNGNGTWTFTPAANYNGAVSLNYNVIDGQGGVTPASQSFSLTAVNDAPVLSGSLGLLADQAQNHAFSLALPAGLFTDIDSPVLTYSATLAGGAALPAWLKIDPATGTLSGTPTGLAADQTYNLVITASDGQLSASTPATSLKVFAGGTVNLTAKADVYTGTIADETINGLAGNDTINAGAGNDVINGGAGNDTMIGGLGNDTFVVDATGDVVTELLGQGIDTVQTALNNYTLPANVENLILTGTAKINGNGNALDNVLLGNGGGNTLNGGAGNDVLCGGLGKDTLTGGAGNDQFLFNSLSVTKTKNVDSVTDFTGGGIAGGDVLVFDSAVFTALGSGVQTLKVVKGTITASLPTDHLIFDTSKGGLYYDADGSGAVSKPVQIATLTGVTALNLADIFIGNSTLAATNPTFGHIDAATGLLMV